MREERGVTLTEVLVILGLLGLLTLISIPSLMDLLRKMEVRTVASAIAVGIRRTQGMAISNHKTYYIVINPSNGSTFPTFCWNPPTPRTIYAIVEDNDSDCRVVDCGTTTDAVRAWGPSLPPSESWIAQPTSQDPFDIGGAAATNFHGTMCFNSRGYVATSVGLNTGTGVYVGNDLKKQYRRVTVELTGRISNQRYVNGSYVE